MCNEIKAKEKRSCGWNSALSRKRSERRRLATGAIGIGIPDADGEVG